MGKMGTLNHSDVERLLKQPSPHVRALVADKLATAMEGPDLSDHELDIAKDIIRKMAMDVEMVVRIAVSKNLRRSRHLPHDVALKLANDIEAVALPILTDSQVLTDDDLIEIVKSTEAVKQKAIASREHISEKLSDTIVTVASETAVATLMGNKGAEISEQSYGKAIDRFSGSELVKERMVMREKLPAAVVERLTVLVSEKLQNHLIAHHNLKPDLADEIMQRSREMAIIAMSRFAPHEEIEHLVQEMHHNGRLTPTIILRGLCTGNLTFFEFAMAKLAGIPVSNASTLIHDEGELALESLCQRAKIPESFVPVFRIALHAREDLALESNQGDPKLYRVRIIERILTQAANMNEKDVDYFLDLINDKVTVH